MAPRDSTKEGEASVCGIVGIYAKSAAVEANLGVHLAAMLTQMSDRGPDSAGIDMVVCA